ncbi:RNA ligase-domain-containing protein [Gamsiella multidivaricata]|uniref:RNA ligase-domain-containing protein n=1 Tax=Gamsiella multidivaricata TaxID=101098 RepID=UPI00221FB987|nr:RNA ligase-domain-containing protein [Gamsiella multidivaricata]KAG0371130.1 hypothetical protein BGZ54_010104 [Gamsiella multidivaricata]KAI7830420.1 RNA ligase-domain-containing protein [Gamsiella multidivaricata]
MDQLAKQLQQTRIQDYTTKPTGKNRVLDDATRADSLIRDLRACTENKDLGTSKRRRKLVYGTNYDLDLEREGQHSSSSHASLAKSKTSGAHEPRVLKVTSWKMNEYDYVKGTLPSLARGLFTYQDPALHRLPSATKGTTNTDADTLDDTDGMHRILIRGYDKFFNVGEVQKTQLGWIAENTEGPYEVTLKENGCIIFMAGLPPHLVGPQGGCVVSSKHAIGVRDGSEKDAQAEAIHASKGREWLEKTLAAKGRTLQEFGLWLWNQNLTAVAELCDDSFEEHVLRYPADKAGLYLHGLNRNTAVFQTLPSSKVQEVAKEWGLRQTGYVTFDSFKEVMDFTEKVRNAGEYDSRAVEGFVVRCRTKTEEGAYFFKIKYDEPYLMYREWRELTKRLLNIEAKKAKGADNVAISGAPLRMKYPLTKAYIEFIKDLIKKQPEIFAGYNKNQGIIAIRDMFLSEWESKSPKDQKSSLAMPSSDNGVTQEDFQRTVLIPIATIGCGKTTVSVALSKLFGWTHVNSDDFNHFRKNPGQKFIKEVVSQLKENMVVIADRNNFEYMHRQRIMEAVRGEYPKTRFVALYWSHDDLPIERIREMAIERVKNRGSNHQSLTPEYCPDYEFVIQKFLRSFEPFNPMIEPDASFSNVVESKAGEDSLAFVERIVKEFAIPTLGAGGIGNSPVPGPKEIKEAVRYAIEDWKPERVASGEAERRHKEKQASEASPEQSDQSASSTLTGDTATMALSGKQRRAKEPKYFAIALESGSVQCFLEELIGQTNIGTKNNALWKQFKDQFNAWKENHRVGIYQHVTLIHTSARKDTSPKKAQRAEELWKLYTEETAGVVAVPTKPKSSSPTTSPPTTSMSALSTNFEQSLSVSSSPGEDRFTRVEKRGRRGKVPPAAASSSNTMAPTPATPPSNPTVPILAATTISSAGGQLEKPELEATVVTDYIIWTENIIALRVSSAKRAVNGKMYDTVQPNLHVTVGTAGDHIKPYESNEMLRLWRENMKHIGSESKQANGPQIFSIKLNESKVFAGHLKGMLF